MIRARLSAAAIAAHLADHPPDLRRLALDLRRTVLKAAPAAAEAIRFNCLCYYRDDEPFKAIGGNICMIEVRRGAVWLSFIQGAGLDDPGGLLQGRGKAKRRAPIPDRSAAADPRIAALVRRSAER